MRQPSCAPGGRPDRPSGLWRPANRL